VLLLINTVLISLFASLQVLDLISSLIALHLNGLAYEKNPLFGFVNKRTLKTVSLFITLKTSLIIIILSLVSWANSQSQQITEIFLLIMITYYAYIDYNNIKAIFIKR